MGVQVAPPGLLLARCALLQGADDADGASLADLRSVALASGGLARDWVYVCDAAFGNQADFVHLPRFARGLIGKKKVRGLLAQVLLGVAWRIEKNLGACSQNISPGQRGSIQSFEGGGADSKTPPEAGLVLGPLVVVLAGEHAE